jgi:hypothetical protein
MFTACIFKIFSICGPVKKFTFFIFMNISNIWKRVHGKVEVFVLPFLEPSANVYGNYLAPL